MAMQDAQVVVRVKHPILGELDGTNKLGDLPAGWTVA